MCTPKDLNESIWPNSMKTSIDCSDDTVVIYDHINAPTQSCEIFRNYSSAVAVTRGDLELRYTPETGLISNRLFEESTQEFSSEYDGSQQHSNHFSRYTESLIISLQEKVKLGGCHILEIGCGDGEFLINLCKYTGASGTGLDPAFPRKTVNLEGRQTVELLPERLHVQHCSLKPDFIICRHTLEHIYDVSTFLRYVREIIQDRYDVYFYLDVPDASRIFKEGAFWDIYYEHAHYFSAGSLAQMLRDAGFKLAELYREFDDQYLCALANVRPEKAKPRKIQRLPLEQPPFLSPALLQDQMDNFKTQIEAWKSWFDAHVGHRVVLWGGGSKAVAFVSTLGLKNSIVGIVDVNPGKWETYLAGSGHQIMSPTSLLEVLPQHIIVMNPVYSAEIQEILSGLSIQTKLWAVGALPLASTNS